MKFLVFLALSIAVCHASCPSSCSGNGKCGEFDKCECFARWVGNDCSQRQCPYGLSWVADASTADTPAGGSLGGQHAYTACSSRGVCTETGECECFPGYTGRACSRTTCPNDCSGHGRCQFNEEIGYGTTYTQFNAQTWDAMKTRQCSCDRGYSGFDCSERMCPTGDDPLTQCNNDQGTSENDVQKLAFTAATSSSGYFTLSFKDMFNGRYTTRPIMPKFSDASDRTATAADVKEALEELPNFAIPNVTVSVAAVAAEACSDAAHTDAAACAGASETWGYFCSDDTSTTQADCEDGGGTWTSGTCTGATVTDLDDDYACGVAGGTWAAGTNHIISTSAFSIYVEFVHPANTGKQNTLEVNIGAAASANYQPRHAGLGGAAASATHLSLDSNDAYKEDAVCSNRGNCDTDSGLCECFEGYTGEACSDQTVFF